MKDDKERNYFSLRTMFWKCLLPMLKCAWKVHFKNWTFQWQKVYKNVINWIVAANALARFRIVTHCYATSFSRKIILYETNNIYSLGNQKWDKTNSWSLKYIESKYELRLDSFANFAYVSSYLSENTPKITSIGTPITEKCLFKKLKILSFLAPFISKIKTVDISNFLSVRYFSNVLLFMKA